MTKDDYEQKMDAVKAVNIHFHDKIAAMRLITAEYDEVNRRTGPKFSESQVLQLIQDQVTRRKDETITVDLSISEVMFIAIACLEDRVLDRLFPEVDESLFTKLNRAIYPTEYNKNLKTR